MLDCMAVGPSGVRRYLVKMSKRIWLAKEGIEELREEVWFDLVKAFLRRRCNDSWTHHHRAQARACVINGAVSRRDFKKFACVRRNRCKTCDGPGAKKQTLKILKLEKCWDANGGRGSEV